MQIGFIGLGKLGLPCAMAIEAAGHSVLGHDPSSIVKETLEYRQLPYLEAGAEALLKKTQIRNVPVSEVVRRSEIIFVAVQTPHDAMYEGVTPSPDIRSDFHYGYLCAAVKDVAQEIEAQEVMRTVVIISTVLPGTIRRYVRPLLGPGTRLVYNPFFIAMGTCIADFTNPEFVLVGKDDEVAAKHLTELYGTIHNRPVFLTTLENAELIKVAYNVFIGMKIVFGNTIMEICHKTPNTHCDSVINAFALATDRLVSQRYLRGGMGDSGGCHPRDQIALSWLAERLSLSHDLFDDIMLAREDQTQWLVELIVDEMRGSHRPLVLFGRAFKPNINIDVGSAARLLSHYLKERNISHTVVDPYVIAHPHDPIGVHRPDAIFPVALPILAFISTRHDAWREFQFPPGSTVIDPFRYLHENPSIAHCKYVPVGVGPKL